MKRSAALVALVCAAGAAEPVQPVMLPQAELVRRLDPAQEWLFLPLGEWRALIAASRPAQAGARIGGGLADCRIQVDCTPAGCTATAIGEAVLAGRSDAVLPLFATAPDRLDALSIAGAPGLALAQGAGLAALLPGPGRWPLGVRWSRPAPAGSDAGWSATLPLPLAGAMDVVLTAPPDWELHGPGLAADGPGRWRLAASARELAIDFRRSGGQAIAWGTTQSLSVELPAAGAGGTFLWALGDPSPDMPADFLLRLPPGFTALQGGEILPDGSVRLHHEDHAATVCLGVVAAGAAIDLPTIAGARWQGGRISVDIAAPAMIAAPAGWIPQAKGMSDHPGARHFSLSGPGHPLTPTALAADAGLDLRSAGAVVVSGGNVRASWGLEVRSSARLHRIDAVVPAGWRLVAADAGDAALDLPPLDEVPAKPWPLAIALPAALPAGTVRTVVLTLERPVADSVELVAPGVTGASRSSVRVLLAADRATEVTLQPPGGSWRLGPPAGAGGALEAVAELLATDAAPPLVLGIRSRPVRLEAEAACWLLPRADDCLVRLDLRLAATGGAPEAVAIDLPAALGDGWAVESGAAVLRDGRLAWPAAWTGERLVRLAARLPADAGRTAAVRPRLALGGSAVPLRLSVAALGGDRVDVSATTAGRVLEPDEMPRWSAPPPETRILAAWRPGADGDAGAVAGRSPQLHDGPPGFLDQVTLLTQVGPGGGSTLLSARLAAPGLAALPLLLPPGMSLDQALVDGEIAPIRRDGGDRLAVILPGRTQVQIALRLRHPAAPGDLALALPAIDLPWLGTRWTLAVAPAWLAEPLPAPGAMPMHPGEPPPRRRLFGSWQAAPLREAARPEQRALAVPAAVDPRLLGGEPQPAGRPSAVTAPAQELIGATFSGERIGAPAGAHLRIAALATLQREDRIGRLLGLVAGAILAGLAMARRLAPWRCAALTLAAGCAAAALLLAQTSAGPLLGACEALLLAAPVAGLIALRRHRPEATP